ncbi:hypothetical protein P3S67_001750 [Capsicum chacoense]
MVESEQWVISFHLADEKFIVTPMPNMCGKHLKLRALGDRVCVVGTFGERTSIWSLEKDVKPALFTWNFITKFPTLGSVIGIPQCSGEFICIKEKGNILRRRKHGGQFIEYNAQKDEHIEFSVKEIHKYMGQMP